MVNGVEHPAAVAAADPVVSNSPSPRVLVVDDDATLRPAIVDTLRDFGLDVIGEAADGASAVAAARASRPDVVVTDMRMPGMDGVEAAAHMRKDDADIEIVMLTAYEDPTLKEAAIKAGVGEYLVKGGPVDLLLEAIERAWQRRRDSRTRGI